MEENSGLYGKEVIKKKLLEIITIRSEELGKKDLEQMSKAAKSIYEPLPSFNWKNDPILTRVEEIFKLVEE